MAKTELLIKAWGNGLGVRLPAKVARAAKLKAEQRVRLEVHGKTVVIRPVADPELTLEERLARFDPEKHGGEAPASGPVGAERF